MRRIAIILFFITLFSNVAFSISGYFISPNPGGTNPTAHFFCSDGTPGETCTSFGNGGLSCTGIPCQVIWCTYQSGTTPCTPGNALPCHQYVDGSHENCASANACPSGNCPSLSMAYYFRNSATGESYGSQGSPFFAGFSYIDTIPPSTAYTWNGNYNGVPGQTYSFSISCSDVGSGCSTINYCKTLYNSPSCILSSVGNSFSGTITTADRIYFQSVDNVGGIEGLRTKSVIDTIAPYTSYSLNPTLPDGFSGNNWWYKTMPTITLSCSDEDSGCSQIKYCIDTTNSCTPTTIYSGPFTSSVNGGPVYVRYYSTDRVNNIETTRTISYYFDTNAPTSSSSLNPNANVNGYYNSSPTISLSCSDPLTGCFVTKWCVDTGNTCTPSTNYSSGFTSVLRGNVYARYYSTDNNGNVETTKSSPYKVDTTLPMTTNNYDGTWRSSDTIVSFSCTDDFSGCNNIKSCFVDDGFSCTPNFVGSSITVTCQAGLTCRKRVYYQSQDNAFNIESMKNVLVLIDKQGPSTTMSILPTSPNVVSGYYNSAPTISFSCSDSGAGCSQIKYCIDTTNSCTPAITYSTSFLNIIDGNPVYVRYYSTDVFGNIENVKSSNFKEDQTPVSPSITITNIGNDSFTVSVNSAGNQPGATYNFCAQNCNNGVCSTTNCNTYSSGNLQTLGGLVVNNYYTIYANAKSTFESVTVSGSSQNKYTLANTAVNLNIVPVQASKNVSSVPASNINYKPCNYFANNSDGTYNVTIGIILYNGDNETQNLCVNKTINLTQDSRNFTFNQVPSGVEPHGKDYYIKYCDVDVTSYAPYETFYNCQYNASQGIISTGNKTADQILNYDSQNSTISILNNSLVISFGRNDNVYDNSKLGSGYIYPNVLVDLGGNDIYNCTGDYCEGSASATTSILYDDSGNDVYFANGHAQGYGESGGLGILIDRDGINYYFCGSECQGDGQSGGTGILYTSNSQDNYNAYDYSQGYGADPFRLTEGRIPGTGILFDSGGNDFYACGTLYYGYYYYGYNYHCQGYYGVLMDTGGNDFYSSGKSNNNFFSSSPTSGAGQNYFYDNDTIVPSTDKPSVYSDKNDNIYYNNYIETWLDLGDSFIVTSPEGKTLTISYNCNFGLNVDTLCGQLNTAIVQTAHVIVSLDGRYSQIDGVANPYNIFINSNIDTNSFITNSNSPAAIDGTWTFSKALRLNYVNGPLLSWAGTNSKCYYGFNANIMQKNYYDGGSDCSNSISSTQIWNWHLSGNTYYSQKVNYQIIPKTFNDEENLNKMKFFTSPRTLSYSHFNDLSCPTCSYQSNVGHMFTPQYSVTLKGYGIYSNYFYDSVAKNVNWVLWERGGSGLTKPAVCYTNPYLSQWCNNRNYWRIAAVENGSMYYNYTYLNGYNKEYGSGAMKGYLYTPKDMNYVMESGRDYILMAYNVPYGLQAQRSPYDKITENIGRFTFSYTDNSESPYSVNQVKTEDFTRVDTAAYNMIYDFAVGDTSNGQTTTTKGVTGLVTKVLDKVTALVVAPSSVNVDGKTIVLNEKLSPSDISSVCKIDVRNCLIVEAIAHGYTIDTTFTKTITSVNLNDEIKRASVLRSVKYSDSSLNVMSKIPLNVQQGSALILSAINDATQLEKNNNCMGSKETRCLGYRYQGAYGILTAIETAKPYLKGQSLPSTNRIVNVVKNILGIK